MLPCPPPHRCSFNWRQSTHSHCRHTSSTTRGLLVWHLRTSHMRLLFLCFKLAASWLLRAKIRPNERMCPCVHVSCPTCACVRVCVDAHFGCEKLAWKALRNVSDNHLTCVLFRASARRYSYSCVYISWVSGASLYTFPRRCGSKLQHTSQCVPLRRAENVRKLGR